MDTFKDQFSVEWSQVARNNLGAYGYLNAARDAAIKQDRALMLRAIQDLLRQLLGAIEAGHEPKDHFVEQGLRETIRALE